MPTHPTTTSGFPGGFLWATGIEDTFITDPWPATGRTLEEYELTQHYRFWREDLARVAELGVNSVRYGIPWYRVNPRPGAFDWSWTDEVIPRLHRRLSDIGGMPPATRTWHLYGMGESHIDHRLAGILTGIDGATLHFRTSNPVNHVKLVVRGEDEAASRATLERVEAELRKRIGPGIYGIDGETFPSAVAKALKAQEATLAIAESCTGGLAGQLVTSESGASSFFRGSIVAYADEVKTGVLGVKPETIADFGAVSEPTARPMSASTYCI